MASGLSARVEALAARLWWQATPSLLARLLQPLAWVYGALARWHAQLQPPPRKLPVPVVVVGNCVVGGAGKTPTVIALVQALQAAGHRPGVISRGHGRSGAGTGAPHEVHESDSAATAGDEPLLIRRRCQVPVFVGRRRALVGRALCAAHPQVDVIVSDDGLQHRALARDAELMVFDERGIGNGLLLPAGPLREPLAAARGRQVLYTCGLASTALAGALALRRIHEAWPLQAWHAGTAGAALPLSSLVGQPLLAVAGLAAPYKFFGMLTQQGLSFEPCPLPDHHPYVSLPWPPGTSDVITTEKDAVKLVGHELGATRVWVVPLDLALPEGLLAPLMTQLFGSAPHDT